MISIEALSAAGLTNKRLKEIFTAQPPEGKGRKVPEQKKDAAGITTSVNSAATLNNLQKLPKNPTDWDRRCFFETLIRDEICEGQQQSAKKFNRFGTIDLAFTSMPIHPLVSDLMKAAMGHLSLEALEAQTAGLTDESKAALFERDAKGKVVAVNHMELIRVAHNLVHSLTTRRVAALATEVYQQFPVLKYDPFSNNQTGRLVGDVMTQLAEQMAGAYGYRHDYEESIRQASLYTTSIKFKANRWDVDKQTLPVPAPRDGAAKAGREAKPKFERKIVKEGVLFTIPHPTNVYHDLSQPLSKLNNDKGPRWIGHWDVVTLGEVMDDPAYFNTDAIALDTEVYSFFNAYAAYFSQYYGGIDNFENAQKIFPGCCGQTSAAALSLSNDRTVNIGAWAQNRRNVSTVLTQHYKKIVPKNMGLGSYQDPVWIRFVAAANTTIVYAEIVGSCPASVNSYNASDGLIENRSFAEDAMQWQQMLTNQLNMLVRQQYQAMVEIWALNKDGMSKGDIDKITNQLKNPSYTNIANSVLIYSAEKLSQQGTTQAKGADRLTRIAVDNSAKIRDIFDQMVQTLAFAERLMFFSPQELGQVSPRSVTATEMKAVRDTTLGIRDFHLIGVKQQIDADKRIIHDSYMAFGSDELEVPVAERYEPKVIEAAGFEIVDDGSGNPPDGLFTIRGKKLGLYYNYTYTTRNTDDTPPDAVVGQGIAQMYEIASKDPVISENLPLEQRFEWLNGLMKKYAPDLPQLRVPPGADGKKTGASVVGQMQQTLQQLLPQIGKALQGMQQKQQQLEAQQAQSDASLKAVLAAMNRLTAAVSRGPAAGPSTKRGQIAPEFPVGVGAPPLRGVRQPQPVPAL